MNPQAELFRQDRRGAFTPRLGDLLPLPYRRLDPSTSEDAAVEHARSGRLDTECGRVLNMLRTDRDAGMYPPTSRELAFRHGVDRHMVAKRLSDLEKAGRVRKGPARTCRVGRRAAMTWGLVS